MYILGRPATYAAQLLFYFFVTNSALPTPFHIREGTTDLPINVTLGLDNETPIRLPNGIPWSPETSTSQAPIPYPVPHTAITLNFTHFGYKIPVVRALSIIYEARQEVLSHLASSPDDATTNHNFEYSTRSTSRTPRVCYVAVQTYAGFGLSWLQVDQILEGLTQFTSGAGIDRQVHYQGLQFEINLTDEIRVGIGLLWCTPGRGRGAAEVEERAEVPIANKELEKRVLRMSELGSETFPDSSNTSSLLLSSAADVPFPVPGTDISPALLWLGNPIPNTIVNEALHGASLKIAPCLKESGSKRIPHDRFFYWITAGKVYITIQIYGMIQLSWLQVKSIIAGLFRYSNGIGTKEHFKNLGFDVKYKNSKTIAYGTLLAIPIYDLNTINTVDSNNEKRSPPIPSVNTPPLLQPPTSNLSSSPYPIPSTDLTLLFTYTGAPLPIAQVHAAIKTARRRIRAAVRATPDRPIGAAGFEHHVGAVQVVVMPYEGAEMSWVLLGEVLRGLAGYCAAVWNKRLLVFEVEVEGRGRVGAGRLWWFEGGGGGGGVVKKERGSE